MRDLYTVAVGIFPFVDLTARYYVDTSFSKSMCTITSSEVVVKTFFDVTLTVRVLYLSPPREYPPTLPAVMS